MRTRQIFGKKEAVSESGEGSGQKTHTPGPLYVSRDVANAAQFTVCKSHNHQPNAEQAGVGYSIATARCYNEADAILYAAAPDLLEALKEALAWNDSDRAGMEEITPDQAMLEARQRLLRAAIGKAEGWAK